MKIALFGASGKTGHNVLEQALAAGHDVVALARAPLSTTHAKLQVKIGDVTAGRGVDDVVAGANAVIACLGARTLKANTVRSDSANHIVAAMKKHGVKKLVWLSASGVGDSASQAKTTSFVFGYIIMPLMLKANYADADVAERVIRESGLDFVVVRPVGLTDKPKQGGARAYSNTDRLPQSYITRADVAAFMIDAATSSTYDRGVRSLSY
jgi:putative NADH-flavin reductase